MTCPPPPRGPAPHLKPVTELGRILVKRLAHLEMSQNRFMELVCERLGKPFTRGQSGFVSMVISGRRPLPLDVAKVWSRVLGFHGGSTEAREFEAAVLAHRAFTAMGGSHNKSGAAFVREVETTEAENRALRDRVAALEAEIMAQRHPRGSSRRSR